MSQDELSTTRVAYLGNSHVSILFPPLLGFIQYSVAAAYVLVQYVMLRVWGQRKWLTINLWKQTQVPV